MKLRRGKHVVQEPNESAPEHPSSANPIYRTEDEAPKGPASDPFVGAPSFESDTSMAFSSSVATLTLEDTVEKTTVRIGELLLERGLANEAQIDQGLARQRESGGRLGEILVNMGVVGERSLAEVLAWKFDMPECDLRTQAPQPEALALVPDSIAREQLALPVSLSGNDLFVAVAEPSDALERLLIETTQKSVHMMLVPLSDVRQSIDANYVALGDVSSLVEVFETIETGRRRPVEIADVETIADDAPVVRVVNRILTQALRDRASDVHLEPQEDGMRVRYRIDGVMKDMLKLPPAMGVGLVNRIKIMSDMNIVEKRRPQDGQFTANIDNRAVDVRVSTVSTIFGETCVMRILDKTKSVLTLSRLGMPHDLLSQYSEIIRVPFGMIVCAGPTGSGKTTTLYASLNELNETSRNIMTIEDPVEYVFSSMNQIQTNEQAGLTFATGLKSILRQDPDVILVGEIRDVETARIGVQSAMTGHLVLSSLHATDAVTALLRFYDMGVEPFLVAASMLGVISQRLVRRTCPACKTPYRPTAEELAFYEESEAPEKTVFLRGSGCNFCAQTGYQERIGVYELLAVTPAIKRLIIDNATDDQFRKAAREEGMRSLRQQAIELVAQDVTTIGEVMRSIYTL
jgi:type IV pilus assembly protein PilB